LTFDLARGRHEVFIFQKEKGICEKKMGLRLFFPFLCFVFRFFYFLSTRENSTNIKELEYKLKQLFLDRGKRTHIRKWNAAKMKPGRGPICYMIGTEICISVDRTSRPASGGNERVNVRNNRSNMPILCNQKDFVEPE